MATTHRFWKHETRGEIFAVRMTMDGVLTGVCGPLHHSSVYDRILPDFEYDSGEDLDWLIDNNGRFRVYDPQR